MPSLGWISDHLLPRLSCRATMSSGSSSVPARSESIALKACTGSVRRKDALATSAYGTKRTSHFAPPMSAIGGKADMRFAPHMSAFDPKRTLCALPSAGSEPCYDAPS